jgi:hypothetical protein
MDTVPKQQQMIPEIMKPVEDAKNIQSNSCSCSICTCSAIHSFINKAANCLSYFAIG